MNGKKLWKTEWKKKKAEKCVGEPARATHVINYTRFFFAFSLSLSQLIHMGILDSVSSLVHVPIARLRATGTIIHIIQKNPVSFTFDQARCPPNSYVLYKLISFFSLSFLCYLFSLLHLFTVLSSTRASVLKVDNKVVAFLRKFEVIAIFMLVFCTRVLL